jgi:hypothetical protein
MSQCGREGAWAATGGPAHSATCWTNTTARRREAKRADARARRLRAQNP